MRDHVMAYLVKPVKQADLEAAIDMAMMRFEHFRTLRKEAADLRQALEDRKLVERAKGILMRRISLREEDAFRRMQKLASVHNHKLTDVSRRVLAAEEIFTELEQAAAPGGRPIQEARRSGPEKERQPSRPRAAPAQHRESQAETPEGDREKLAGP